MKISIEAMPTIYPSRFDKLEKKEEGLTQKPGSGREIRRVRVTISEVNLKRSFYKRFLCIMNDDVMDLEVSIWKGAFSNKGSYIVINNNC